MAQAWLAELPAPAMLHIGNALPRAKSRISWVIVGTHWEMARQFGAARQSKTWQPSTAAAGRLVPRSMAAVASMVAVRIRWAGITAAFCRDALRGAKDWQAFMAGWRWWRPRGFASGTSMCPRMETLGSKPANSRADF